MPARCPTSARPDRADPSRSSTSTPTPTPGIRTSARSTTTAPGCGARSRRASLTLITRSRSACAARSTTATTGRACESELGLEYVTTEQVLPAVRRRPPRRSGRGSRSAGVHQLRHRRRRSGVRTRDRDARAGRPVGPRRARDRARSDRHRLRRVSTSSRSSRPTTRPARRRSSPRTSPTRCSRSWPCGVRPRDVEALIRRALDWHSPMPAGFRWPDGIRAAACFTFDLDAESPILFEHPESADWLDVMTHQAYGPRTGVPAPAPPPRTPRHPGDVLRARLLGRALAGRRPGDPRRRPRDRPSRLPPRVARAARPRRKRRRACCAGLEALDRVAGVRPVGLSGADAGR